jgi:hypothetical protein
MITLNPILADAQKRTKLKPVYNIDFTQRSSWVGGFDSTNWRTLQWEKIWEDASVITSHGSCMPSDGSLVRIATKNNGVRALINRVASPSVNSDFSWGETLTVDEKVAIACSGAYVIAVMRGNWNYTNAGINMNTSTNYGATWKGWEIVTPTGNDPITSVSNPYLAVALKDTSNACIAWTDAATEIGATVLTRSGSDWSVYNQTKVTMTTTSVFEGITMYYDGDYNIVLLQRDGTRLSLVRSAFGDGGNLTARTWGDEEYLNLGSATIEEEHMMTQYLSRFASGSDWSKLAQDYVKGWQQSKRQTTPITGYSSTYRNQIKGWLPLEGGGGTLGDLYSTQSKFNQPYIDITYDPSTGSMTKSLMGTSGTPQYEDWQKTAMLSYGRGTDNLDMDAPFIHKTSAGDILLFCYKNQERWLFRQRPNTDFYTDMDWYKTYKDKTSCTYGLSLCSDSTYLWGTRNNQIWRAKLPGGLPTVHTDTNASPATTNIAQGIIKKYTAKSGNRAPGSFFAIVDNRTGTYDNLPSGALDKGSIITLNHGYKIDGTAYTTPRTFYLEDWNYDRSPGHSLITFVGIDAWGLLQKFRLPTPVEYNQINVTEKSVADLLSDVLTMIGATLTNTYTTGITDNYPKIEWSAGETGLDIVNSLLDLTPYSMRFNALAATIIYPQSTDSSVYWYYFAKQKGGVG